MKKDGVKASESVIFSFFFKQDQVLELLLLSIFFFFFFRYFYYSLGFQLFFILPSLKIVSQARILVIKHFKDPLKKIY